MKQKKFLAVFLLVLVAGMSVISASVSYQIRPGNQINEQIPHFEYLTNKGICKTGDTFSKHLDLTKVANVNGSAEADINAYNYDERDRVRINLRSMRLMPKTVYTVWIMNSNTSMYLGEFKTNSAGRGVFNFKQQMNDFTIFDKIVVMNENTWIFREFLNLKCACPQD